MRTTTTEHFDAIVIGAGAAGSVFADELTRTGKRVLILEKGPRFDDHFKQFPENESGLLQTVWDNSQYMISGDGFSGSPTLGQAVGGGTLAWAAGAFRLLPHDFRLRSDYGQPSGTTVEDWPITLADLSPFYDRAEDAMGVSRHHLPWYPAGTAPAPNPPFGYYPGSKALQKGMDTLGLRSAPGPVAINSKPYKKRPECLHCGFCRSGCRIDAKYQSDATLIRQAEKTGMLVIRHGVVAERLHTTNRGTRVEGVTYIDTTTGNRHYSSADVVVACNNPIEIPRLFLSSPDEFHPLGLANRHDQVGRNFFCHPATIGTGVTNECLNAAIGFNMGNIITLDHCTTDSPRDYIGGFSFQALNGAGAGVMAIDPYLHMWGSELKRAMENYNNSFFFICFCEGMPVAENRIMIDTSRQDNFGRPMGRVHYKLHDNDRAVFQRALDESDRIARVSGAHSVHLTTEPFDSHPMGSMRMGNDERTSVADAQGKVHGLDNMFIGGAALFVTGSSVNPTLTIHALALRTADFINNNWGRVSR